MKNKLLLFIIMAFVLSIGILQVQAEDTCTYSEKADLNETAGKIKNNYEVNRVKKDIEVQDPDADDGVMMTITQTDYTFVMKLYNITDDVYLVQTNDYDDNELTVYYSDTTDGVYTFTSTDIDNIIKYTFDVYAKIDDCVGTKLKTFTVTKPSVNPYYSYSICDGLSDEVSYCKELLTESVSVSEEQLSDAVTSYYEQNSTEEETTDNTNAFIQFLKDNYIYVIVGVVLVTGAIVAIIIIRKRRAL